jgi:ABC-2 type transport system permease protein
MTPVLAFFRLELAETLRSRWMAFAGALYAALFGTFVWMGLRESSVLGFTGLSRVVLNVANAVVLVAPLMALVSTSQTVVRARQSGLFELMLTQPARRSQWFTAALAARCVVLMAPLVVLFVGALLAAMAALGGADRDLAPVVLRAVTVTCALTIAFLGVGFWISASSRTPERATVLALCAWAAASALHDFALIGVLLQWRVAPGFVFALSAANPVEAARVAVLASVDPDLSVLGPVGFWLANTLGQKVTWLVGVSWPIALGLVTLACAQRRLGRSDLVG